MAKSPLKVFVVASILSILLASCGSLLGESVDSNSPEAAYWEYWEACDAGKLTEAESMITEAGRLFSQSYGYGICSLTHDFIYKARLFGGPQESLPEFSSAKPDVHLSEDTATLTWVPQEGVLTHILVLKNIDGQWLVEELVIMD